MTKHHYSWLALGDSYTIGEGVPLHLSYPYQTLQLLRKKHFHFHAPEIIAQTGWTSFELADHLLHYNLSQQYDIVTLLIGVNNQYRNLPIEAYNTDLHFLIKKALHLVGGHSQRVILLSIPDWGVTPFAQDRDTAAIATAINSFNQVKASAAAEYGIHCIDITPYTRQAKEDASLLTTDQLHPSGAAYTVWAELLATQIATVLQ